MKSSFTSTWLSTLLSTWLSACSLALLLLMQGCGPGLGGTGTGDSVPALAAFNAQRASPCASDLAALLACPASTAGAPSLLPAARWLADGNPAARVQADISDSEIQLLLRCQGWRFEGTWGQSAAFGTRWYGHLTEAPGSNASRLATLTGQVQGDQLVVTLFDAAGSLLAGPVKLTVVPAATSPAACSP
jgi:hypothetical protein